MQALALVAQKNTMVDTLLSVSLGIGLAAACGFRVFVPLLIAGLVARTDYLTLSDNFEWISSWPAIGAFAVAAALEIGAYYLPWLDNALDAIAAPAAVLAGVILAAALIHDLHPLLKCLRPHIARPVCPKEPTDNSV